MSEGKDSIDLAPKSTTENTTVKLADEVLEVIQGPEVSEACDPVDDVQEVEDCEPTEVEEVAEVAIEVIKPESENAGTASVNEVPEKQTEETNQKDTKPEVVKIVSNQQKLYENARETWSRLSDECISIIRSAIDLLRSSSSDIVKEVLDDRKVLKFLLKISITIFRAKLILQMFAQSI